MATEDDHCDHLRSSVVSVTETLSVFPKVLHPPQVLTLSNLDRQCPVHMYLVLFYNKNNSLLLGDDDSVFGTLKSGLEEALSVWYPAAGRLMSLTTNPSSTGDDGTSSNYKLNLWCNNKGAVLVEGETEVEISALGDLSQYNDFFDKLVYKPVFDGDWSQMPLVVAQVTKFGCGGYSIGIGISHSVFDGPAAYDFMRAWASNSSITKEDRDLEMPNNKLPVHGRDELLANGDDVVVARAAAVDHLYQLMMQAAAAAAVTSDQVIISKSYVHKTFHLSGALIESLKREVFGEETGSSFEVVAAHLWKAKTKAVGVGKGTMVCLQFSVDARNKVTPPLPAGFSGNAYVLASVALTAEQVEQATHKAIVEKIREAKNSVTNSYVRGYMEAVGGPQTSLPPLKELTLVSDWTRMPFHKIGFLQESAAYASPLVSPVPEVTYFMQNPKDDKGIDMRVGLLPQYLSAFTQYWLASGATSENEVSGLV